MHEGRLTPSAPNLSDADKRSVFIDNPVNAENRKR